MATPYIIIYSIAGVAAVVWLFGLTFLLRIGKMPASSDHFWADESDAPIDPGQAAIRGFVEVAGRPADLAAKAAAHLAQHGATGLGPVKILEQNDIHLAFEGLPHLGGCFLQRGALDFQAQGSDRTQIDYAVLVPKRSGLLIAAWAILFVGLVVLVGGFIVMLLWVAPSPHAAVRGQAFQMVHVVHFLWPPFVLGSRYRSIRTHVRNVMESLVNNLPYLQ